MIRQTKKHFNYDISFAQQYSQYSNFDQLYDFFVNKFIEIHGEPSGTLVDLCCGTGNIANNFKSNFKELSVTGSDESSEMLSFADHRNVSFVNAPIKFVNEKFDNVVSNNAYHHFDNVDDFWSVVNQITHSNSKILISDVVRPNTEDQVSKIVEDILGKKSIFSESFILSLTSSYTEEELHSHKGLNNLIIVDTPIDNYKLFFIHN
jgi:ubiquinone/menaquinone biosynthesis C-methylase UbiE